MTESGRAWLDRNGPEATYAVERKADSPTATWARVHTTSWFHPTDLSNVPPRNLVQIGIGGRQAPRSGVRVGRERGTPTMTVTGRVEMGCCLLRAGHLPERREN